VRAGEPRDAAADRWTTSEARRPFFDRSKGPRELVMLENCGHFPIQEPGISRLEEVVVAFLKKLAQPEPSSPPC
jgi:alpha-beta hydrolase superfamily lysophospholipase